MDLRASITFPIEPSELFELILEELGASLRRAGMRCEMAPDEEIVQGTSVVGRIRSWEPGKRVSFEWPTVDWADVEPERPGATMPASTEVTLRFESVEDGTMLTIEHKGWGEMLGDADEQAAWFAGEFAAPMLRSMTPAALGDWFTDRMARRPSGAQARAIYRDPLYHYPNFLVILAELALTPDDYLLEVGCGGGAFLRIALESGCRAAAVDHSPDMVRLAKEENLEAVRDGRLQIKEASADSLPFDDATFTCAAMTGVLGFVPDPVTALAEMRRVLAPGGRLVVMGSDPELRGTMGAPEPMASRLRFYDDAELAELGRMAGLDDVQVIGRDLEPHARAAGVPEEHVPLFSGRSRFLLGRRS